MEKIRVKFTKMGDVKYIGHLDVLALFDRATRRAGIPMAFSEGFNPRPKLSFAHPLAVGIESNCEYMEMELTREVNLSVVKEKLNAILPEGVEIIEVVKSPSNKAIMALVTSAEYIINIESKINNKEKIEKILNQEEILIEKMGKNKGKKVIKTMDIKPLIQEYEISDDGMAMKVRLVTGSAENLRPDILMDEIAKKIEIDDYRIIRTNLEIQ